MKPGTTWFVLIGKRGGAVPTNRPTFSSLYAHHENHHKRIHPQHIQLWLFNFLFPLFLTLGPIHERPTS